VVNFCSNSNRKKKSRRRKLIKFHGLYYEMATRQSGNSPESRQMRRLLNRYWEPDFSRDKKKDEGISLPEIGEVSGVMSAMRNSRPPKLPTRVHSSVHPAVNDVIWSGGYSRKCYSAALPPGSLRTAEKSHFSCILCKELGQDGVQRVAQSATFSTGDRGVSAKSKESRRGSSSRGTVRVALREQPRVTFIKAVDDERVHKMSIETLISKNPGTETGVYSRPPEQVKKPISKANTDKAASSNKRIPVKRTLIDCGKSRLSICNLLVEKTPTPKHWIMTTEMEPFRSFSVKTFGENGTKHVWINVRNPVLDDKIKVGRLKSEVGYQLMIEPESMPMFGIFQGSLCDPTTLLQDNDSVPEHDSHFCMMKVCFDPPEERAIVTSDCNAMELIFWEIQSKLSTGYIYPSLSELTQKRLDSFTEEADSVLNHLSTDGKKKFLEIFVDLPFFTSYYHNRGRCFIKNTFLLKEWGITADTEAIASVSEWKLTIIDKYEEKILQSWSWSTIRSLSMALAPKPMLEMEVQDGTEEKEFVKKITIYTEYCNYLYSIGYHIIDTHQRRLKQVEDGNKTSLEFINKTFNRRGKLEERRHNKPEKILMRADTMKKCIKNTSSKQKRGRSRKTHIEHQQKK